MRIIKLDASNWSKALDFYDALLASIGASELMIRITFSLGC